MQRSKLDNVLILGKRNKKVREIERTLAEHFLKVKVTSKMDHNIGQNRSMHFNLIVITDSLEDKPHGDFGTNLRRLFPEAKVLGLFDKINAEVETNVRNAGLIFLGSYDQFSKHSTDILRSAFGSKER